MDLLEKNIESEVDTFLYQLLTEGNFDSGKYNELVFFILKERQKVGISHHLSSRTWYFCFLVQRSISYHFDEQDVFLIKKLTAEKIIELSHKLDMLGSLVSGFSSPSVDELII